MARIGGWALVAGSLAFVAIFTHLSIVFGYPDVLDRPAAEVLPALLAGGPSLRAVWLVYGLLPLCFVLAGVGAHDLARRLGAPAARLGLVLATGAAAAMMLGLLRWPTLQWSLAEAWGEAGPEARIALAATFQGANLFFGTLVGELLGELFLHGWTVVLGLALTLEPGRLRWVGRGLVAAAGVGLVAALRNAIPAVAPIADLNDGLLPVNLVVLGLVVALRGGRAASGG